MSRDFDYFAFLDNNHYPSAFSEFDFAVAMGAEQKISCKSGHAFNDFQKIYQKHPGWWFGYFGYDLKNEIENLSSHLPDRLEFPDLLFFKPNTVLLCKNNKISIYGTSAEKIILKLRSTNPKIFEFSLRKQKIEQNMTREEYIESVKKLKSHIQHGDIYEINYCLENFMERVTINPQNLYYRLNEVSPMPFSCFFKMKNHYIISASPERFLKKSGTTLTSQPIKGTISRSDSYVKDKQLAETLHRSEKDRAENLMIVDLVRNDLARCSVAGSVKVKELFGIYSYPNVHQMISTITSKQLRGLDFTNIIKSTFPMGSMTGAPKVEAMKLIEHYEKSKRGVYSGSAGYISPNGDFDFNVLIRSVFYNSANKNLSFFSGGAITAKSEPFKEYEECMIKTKAIREMLGMS